MDALQSREEQQRRRRERQRERLAAETDEQRERRLSQRRQHDRARCAAQTAEERERRLQRDRARYAARAQNERDRRLWQMSNAALHIYVTCRMHAVLQRYYLTYPLFGRCFMPLLYCFSYHFDINICPHRTV